MRAYVEVTNGTSFRYVALGHVCGRGGEGPLLSALQKLSEARDCPRLILESWRSSDRAAVTGDEL